MYGLINKAIEDFVTQEFGAEAWEQVLEKSGLDAELFISMKTYPDEWTSLLVKAASEVLALPPDDVLAAFGEYWIRFTGKQGYGQLLKACGSTLPSFLRGLDNMHAHIALTFTGSKMPSFQCTELGPNDLQLDYYSQYPGFAPMVIGLLRGLGGMFGNTVDVQFSQSRAAGADHDRFLVHYKAA